MPNRVFTSERRHPGTVMADAAGDAPGGAAVPNRVFTSERRDPAYRSAIKPAEDTSRGAPGGSFGAAVVDVPARAGARPGRRLPADVGCVWQSSRRRSSPSSGSGWISRRRRCSSASGRSRRSPWPISVARCRAVFRLPRHDRRRGRAGRSRHGGRQVAHRCLPGDGRGRVRDPLRRGPRGLLQGSRIRRDARLRPRRCAADDQQPDRRACPRLGRGRDRRRLRGRPAVAGPGATKDPSCDGGCMQRAADMLDGLDGGADHDHVAALDDRAGDAVHAAQMRFRMAPFRPAGPPSTTGQRAGAPAASPWVLDFWLCLPFARLHRGTPTSTLVSSLARTNCATAGAALPDGRRCGAAGCGESTHAARHREALEATFVVESDVAARRRPRRRPLERRFAPRAASLYAVLSLASERRRHQSPARSPPRLTPRSSSNPAHPARPW